MKDFPTSSVVDVTVPGIIDPAPCSYSGTATFTDPTCGKPAVFAETTVTNAGKADVNGIEATWQQMLWLGFGTADQRHLRAHQRRFQQLQPDRRTSSR